MDRKLTAEIVALLLMFAAFPLTSIGATGGHGLVWWLGLLSLIVGGLLPVVTRYMDHSGDKPRDAGMEFDERTS
jgi:nitrate reductase NapE component